jgi:alkylation response protein AidB-like acyl-CoA dehydrogenase
MTTTTHDGKGPATGDLEEFRVRVRQALEDWNQTADQNAGDHYAAGAGSESSMLKRAKAFQAQLFDAGLAALTWPTEYGGQGLAGAFQTAYNEESSDYVLPTGVYTIGFGMCIPTVLAHGTAELKSRYVRPAARGEEIWCQLFSEPGAGSDVASLQTRAVRDGDEYVVNGQKVWTSGAHYCDYGIVLTRTNPDLPKHKGLTMFVLDMHAPGVTVRPLRQINGASGFNEVFFDDVRIPATHVLGDEGEGWRVALTTLMNERVAIGTGRSGQRQTSPLDPIAAHLELAKAAGRTGDPIVRQALADLFIRSRILSFVGLRIRAAIATGRPPGPEGSIAKLAGTQLGWISAQVAAELAGPAAVAWPTGQEGGGRWSQMVVSAPASGIAGGTNEVMRNIIGERVLGLPKDPQVDRDLPFRDLLVGTQSRSGERT